MQNYLFLALIFILTGCAKQSPYQKIEIYQSPQTIAYYENLMKNRSANEVARLAKEDILQKFGGKKRVKVDKYLYFENIHNNGNEIIFDYSFTLQFTEQNRSNQLKMADFMQISLINRVCNLKTARNSLNSGMVEVHRYFYDYPQNMAFILSVSKEICEKAGL